MSRKTAVVSVEIYQDEHNRWHARSDDVFGLFLAAESRPELVKLIPGAIEKLYEVNHGVRLAAIPAWGPDLLLARSPGKLSAVKRKVPEAWVLESEAA